MKWQVFIVILCSSIFSFLSFSAAPLKNRPEKPKLVIFIVIDQLRSDYLTRFESRFLPAKSGQRMGGFNHLIQQGAYFPNAEYDVLHSMTCSGHAMISTGAHPVMNGIIMNDWYDKASGKEVYCADDEKHGLSPKNLKTTTVADEIKNAGYNSKVVGISLKDRSAIMLTGHRADHVYWFNDKFQWETSIFYSSEKDLPPWVSQHNSSIKKKIGSDYVWFSKEKATGLTENADGPFKKVIKIGDKESVSLPVGVDFTFDLAKSAIAELNLGKGKGPDYLAISLSSHDMLGHRHGPNAREMEEMTLYEDRALSDFFNFLQKMGVFKDTVVILTADHGVAPTVPYSQKNKIPAFNLSYPDMIKKINSHFDKKFGPPKAGPWISSTLSLNLYFNRSALSERKVRLEEAEKEAKDLLSGWPGIWHIVTSTESQQKLNLPKDLESQFLNQYSLAVSGDVVLIPTPFSMQDVKGGTTHVTGYSYDRAVPIIFAGKGIKAGLFTEKAKIIDIAPTLSFLLGTIPPATSSGKVLDIF